MSDIQKLKEIFLVGVDEETRQQNLDDITAWETALLQNENKIAWLENPVTQEIIKKAREVYRESAIQIGTNKNLSDHTRIELFAKQDSALWLLSFASGDPKSEMERIQTDIKRALDVTST